MMGEISPQGNVPAAKPSVPAADRLRASHEDRDSVIEALRVAAGDGRLTAEELDERIEVAFSARTYGELAVLTSDLPAGTASAPVTPTAPVEPKNVVRIETRSGNTQRDGNWVVPRRMEVRVTSGNIKLDFTQAVIGHHRLELVAEVRSGNLSIITKPGIVVDTDDLVVRSGNVKVKTPWGADMPATLMITVTGRVGSGNIVARPPRRSFWEWLLRKPRRYAITSGPPPH
jgi:hypothetical protein